ncbi:hypothetical protein LCGC14_0770260 [marine sediment metagenome]|uniref:Uncharacterized protein n=1 Tax=marine sediment metagenome TaxID=412755 RepID=A0A0F9SIN1_9ZZZZ
MMIILELQKLYESIMENMGYIQMFVFMVLIQPQPLLIFQIVVIIILVI